MSTRTIELHSGLARSIASKRLADEVGAEILMRQPLGEAMDDRLFQAVLVEDRRIEERRQQRIALHRLGGFLAHRAPDRVDRLRPVPAVPR